MVDMLPKLTFGPWIADWQDRINMERMRQHREARARQVMRKYEVAVILEGTPGNLRYLTSTRGFEMPGCRYCLFFAEGDTIMYEHSGWYHQMPDQATWIKEWRPGRSWLAGSPGLGAIADEAKAYAADISMELEKRGLLKERVAVGGLDGFARQALIDAGVTNLVDNRNMLLEARAIKNEDEINCFRILSAIVDGMWWKVWENAKPGIRDNQLGAIAVAAGYEAGAEFAVPGGWRSGPMTFDRGFQTSSRILQFGDLLYGSLCGITYLGYGSCTYRSFIIGRKPTEREKDWYKQLMDVVDGVISEIKTGNTTADAAKHFPPASSWGYDEEVEVLCSEIGHGIGLGGRGGYDMPIINRQWSFDHPQEFEEGMVIAVESRQGVQRVGGVRIEDMVVVTKDGPQLLDNFPRDELLVAPMALYGG